MTGYNSTVTQKNKIENPVLCTLFPYLNVLAVFVEATALLFSFSRFPIPPFCSCFPFPYCNMTTESARMMRMCILFLSRSLRHRFAIPFPSRSETAF